MNTIYIVDDEKDLLVLTQKYLQREGYAVKTFENGESAMAAINNNVDLWLLDIMLGGDINGYDLIKAIKEQNPVPAIFMSARDQEFDRIIGLELGSDDYITKPFSMREMVLRVNNVIKHVYGTRETHIKHYGNYKIDVTKRMISENENPLTLTSKEMDLILLLTNNINVSFTRDQLLNSIWGDDYFGSDRVVDDLIKRVRKKIPDLNIETIYGYGYRLRQ
jgi:two-component system response regulator CssR